MRQRRPFNRYLVSALALAAPFAMQGAAISINSTCEIGNCLSVDSLGDGQSTSGTFDFSYTFLDGDTYDISGDYGASYSTTYGSTISVDPVVTYMGAGSSAGDDTIAFTMLQDYFDPSCCTWAGLYTESIPLSAQGLFGAGSQMSGQLFYDGVGVGPVGPFAAPGNHFTTITTALDFGALDGSDTLAAAFDFDFAFAAGTAPGAFEGASSSPEPASLGLTGLGLFVLGFGVYRRNRSMSAQYMSAQSGSAQSGFAHSGISTR